MKEYEKPFFIRHEFLQGHRIDFYPHETIIERSYFPNINLYLTRRDDSPPFLVEYYKVDKDGMHNYPWFLYNADDAKKYYDELVQEFEVPHDGSQYLLNL